MYFPYRAATAELRSVLDVFGWIYVGSLALVSAAFGAGLLRERLFVASALERLTLGLTPARERDRAARGARGRAEDPALRILYRLPGEPERWVDETGRPAELPERAPGRVVAEVSSADGRRIASISPRRVALARPGAVKAATSYALAALENERLVGALQASLDELSRSRSRLVAVADRERRRIERDLHDGAQQRLVALRARLELVAERLEDDSPADAAAIRALGGEVEATIDEVRSFARGIYPSLLIQRGLSEALRAAGRRAPMPTTLDAAGIGRFPPEIEAHRLLRVHGGAAERRQARGRGARRDHGDREPPPALRGARRRDRLRSDAVAGGEGLTNLQDRLAAVGGVLLVESAPGAGCVVSGVIPAPDGQA